MQDDAPAPPAAPNDAAQAPANAPPAAAADGAYEPDNEPNPVSAHADRGGKSEGKIDLRNIKMEQFTGKVPSGAYDSGVRDWWDQFSDQVDDAQVLAAQEWSEAAKKSVLSIFLTDTARRWLKTYRAKHPAATFEDTGRALVAKFCPNLMDQEITARIYAEKKHASETYQEYADRLLLMADALTGGNASSANTQHTLGTFLRLAWPQRKDIVQAHIRGKQGTPRVC